MKKQILSILLLTNLNALETQTIHSSVSLYYEMKEFSNSKQKTDGVVYGIAADIHYEDHAFRMAYEKSQTDTIKSPKLTKNLEVDKIFTRYNYHYNDTFEFNFNYINVLNDNIVPTDKTKAYAMGISYLPNKVMKLNFTQYYVDYQIFESYQSDLALEYKSKYKKLKYKLSVIAKYIQLQNKDANVFSANAQEDYSTVGLKLHSHYDSYHFGFGTYFGKRAFAVMNDGFKLQHHAMEFDKTYAIGVGKTIGDFVLRYQYIYQRAEELPLKNKNVKVSNNRLILNYKF